MEQKTPFRQLSFKNKLIYIWDYYRITILVVTAVTLFAGVLIHSYFDYQKPLLTVVMINASGANHEELETSFDPFVVSAGYSTDKAHVAVNNNIRLSGDQIAGDVNMEDLMLLQTLIGSASCSAMLGDRSQMIYFANSECLRDISEFLSADLLQKYADTLLYVKDPSTGEEYPCAVLLTPETSTWLRETKVYESCYLSLVLSNDDPALLSQFTEYLLR